MSTQHDAVISIAEFWRTLAFVVIGFGVALLLSWAIDAALPPQAQDALSSAQQALG